MLRQCFFFLQNIRSPCLSELKFRPLQLVLTYSDRVLTSFITCLAWRHCTNPTHNLLACDAPCMWQTVVIETLLHVIVIRARVTKAGASGTQHLRWPTRVSTTSSAVLGSMYHCRSVERAPHGRRTRMPDIALNVRPIGFSNHRRLGLGLGVQIRTLCKLADVNDSELHTLKVRLQKERQIYTTSPSNRLS